MEKQNRVVLFLEKKYGQSGTKKALVRYKLQMERYIEQGKK